MSDTQATENNSVENHGPVHIRGRRRLLGLLRQRLWLQVLVGMALGIAFGLAIGPTGGLLSPANASLIGNWVALPGKLFLLAIQFVVIPLVVASVIRGIAGGNTGQLGTMGIWTIGFFLVFTVIAAAIGIALAIVINPGTLIETANIAVDAAAIVQPATLPGLAEFPDVIASIFPKDPLATFVSGNMLQIVIAAVIIGVAMISISGEQRRPLLELLASVQAVAMAVVTVVLRFAPLAVFGLLAQITAQVGVAALLSTAVYMATVLLGLLILLALYLAVAAWTGTPPLRFLRATREPLLLAFSTSSSAAVMPVTLTTVVGKLGVHANVARFVIPLGTTINMGGTALYQGVAALFLAQVYGVDIGLAGMVLIIVMATGAAIGSPGTPGVGIVILSTILASIGVPPSGIAIILGVDRLLDMCRTVANVAGDMVASQFVSRYAQQAPTSKPAPATITEHTK
ncbi:MAG: dicarboxylate/amino acid:cation symporter [Proteobacteria bacterium]|nr:dicarboxylate/amino acid:cation symporter [Pseudomonadota bacterium]MDA1057327.1 dicarboxylate/amino acid:cation symporter [Pseudomonadota bacterium]